MSLGLQQMIMVALPLSVMSFSKQERGPAPETHDAKLWPSGTRVLQGPALRLPLLAVQEETGNYASAVLLLACLCLVASGVAFLFPVAQKRQPHIISVNRSASASRKLQV